MTSAKVAGRTRTSQVRDMTMQQAPSAQTFHQGRGSRTRLTRRQQLQPHDLDGHGCYTRPDGAGKSAKQTVDDRTGVVLPSEDPQEERRQARDQAAHAGHVDAPDPVTVEADQGSAQALGHYATKSRSASLSLFTLSPPNQAKRNGPLTVQHRRQDAPLRRRKPHSTRIAC